MYQLFLKYLVFDTSNKETHHCNIKDRLLYTV